MVLRVLGPGWDHLGAVSAVWMVHGRDREKKLSRFEALHPRSTQLSGYSKWWIAERSPHLVQGNMRVGVRGKLAPLWVTKVIKFRRGHWHRRIPVRRWST